MTKTTNISQVKQMLQNAERSIKEALRLLTEESEEKEQKELVPTNLVEKAKKLTLSKEGKIIEGIFNGQNMIGPDEKLYPVPANYASKSKLVEGDILKLTIAEDGTFVFKQIGPVERKKMIGKIKKNKKGEFLVEAEGQNYKILLATATYFKLEEGDIVTIVVPKKKKSRWAAIENLIKKASLEEKSV